MQTPEARHHGGRLQGHIRQPIPPIVPKTGNVPAAPGPFQMPPIPDSQKKGAATALGTHVERRKRPPTCEMFCKFLLQLHGPFKGFSSLLIR